MGMILETLETVLEYLVGIGILLFEYVGVGIIIVSCIVGLVRFIKHDEETRILLAKGLATGLEFKLGSEILRTVVVREWKEISIVAGIILLRATLTFLIHWEIKQEEKDHISKIQA
ncbi:MAG: DUF1622 domain-containing protein [Erysipelotrichaceae bacterium]|nr:DUF1622 domain-containing protein [Erysipelotrichaceae bacterium]